MSTSLKKRGLSLSISKTKKRTQEQPPTIIPVSKPQTVVAPVAPTIRIQYRNRSGSVQSVKEPKVIYRMRKSEWQQIRDQNLNKNIIVNAMKNQINFLNKSIVQQTSKHAIHIPPPSRPQIKHLQMPQNTQKVEKKPIKSLFKLQENAKTEHPIIREIPSEQNLMSPQKQIVKQFSSTNLTDLFSKTVQFSKKQNVEVMEFTAKKEKSVSTARQYGKRSIDVSALTEIQNRLEHLIEITQN